MRRAVRYVFATCVVVAAAAVAAAACASFNDTPADVPVADAAQDATASEDVSSPADASKPDVVPDVVTDAKPTSPCVDSGHWLCDDFDRDAAAGFPAWDLVLLTDASLGITSLSSAPSPPNVVTSRAGDGQSARLPKARNGSANGLRCEFDMAVEQRNSSAVVLFDITVSNGANYYYRVELRGGAPDNVLHYGAVDGGNLTPQATSTTFQKEWQHVLVDLGVGVGNGLELRVSLDGTSIPVVAPDAGVLAAPTAQSVVVGLNSLGGAGDWVVRYDNVQCD